MAERWEVIVGNIGTVFNAEDGTNAKICFGEYKQMSIDGYGRAAHEKVTLFHNYEIVEEHLPCDHPQLYANLSVTFCVAIKHNSAQEIEAAHKMVTDIGNAGKAAYAGVTYFIADQIEVTEYPNEYT